MAILITLNMGDITYNDITYNDITYNDITYNLGVLLMNTTYN
jgi:hypothetical protein